jgi:RNA polymerase sigma-54 factor
VKQGLSLGFSQSLTLTPQLQQSIRLLQLSSLELEQEIEQQLAMNPFLERDDEASVREQFEHTEEYAPQATLDKASSSAESPDVDAVDAAGDVPAPSADDLDWDGDGTTEMSPNDSEWGVEAGSAQTSPAGQHSDSDFDPLGGLSSATSLTEHLKHQAQHLRLTPTDAASLDFLIESLNERGFLIEPLEELAATLSSDEDDIERLVEQLRIAKHWLQNLDPCGVGAADVSECLRLQLRAETTVTSSDDVLTTALRLLDLPLAVLARRNIKQLATTIERTESLVQQGLQCISRLEPLPSRRFETLVNSVVVPDVFVRVAKSKGGRTSVSFTTELNMDLMPRLKVDEITAQLLRLQKAREKAKTEDKNPATDVMQQALVEARGFIKSISQRFDTVLRVAKAIVARQGQFLQHGAVAMRPLVLRDIADELGLHESTVSRVTTSKYMATPQGTFEFKYFFDASLGTDSGGETSGTAVRALIAQMISAENKTKPLSDGKLAEVLAKQGIECARRTVAKYREAMRIPTASLRRI